MLPLIFVYNYFGSAIVIRSSMSVVLGAVMVTLFFLLPQWIERRNAFSLRKYFRHMQEEIPQEGEIAAKEGNEHHDR